MSQLIGYICSDDSLTPSVVHTVRDELVAVDDYAALGFGWVQEHRSLLRKHPSQGSNGVNALSLLSDLPARSIVGYTESQQPDSLDTLDLQPFRYRNWVYAQEDNVESFDGYRGEVIEDIPDHILRNIHGHNRAEVAFHRFLAAVHEQGQLDGQRVDGGRVARAMAESVQDLEQRAIEHGLDSVELRAVTVSTRLLLAARLGAPLYYRQFDGVEEPGEEPLFAGHRPKPVEHPHFNGVLVASGDKPQGEDWVEVPDRHIMWVDGDWDVQIEAISDLLAGDA
ncbi:MAG: class II glutamine amidotransferase [Myxococcota bacterium]